MKRFYWERGSGKGPINIYDRREGELPVASCWEASVAEQIVEALNHAIGDVE